MACGKEGESSEPDDEKIVSRIVRDMEILSSRNGERDQMMRAAVREEHAFARPAFETYPEGMEVTGYDSLGRPSSRVVADYALHWTERDLWELNGNVVVEGEDGQRLFTQQLRWDRKIKKIYSNVDSKVEEDGDVLYGVGFEAADDFSRWVFRGVTGTVTVEMESVSDSTVTDSIPVPSGETSDGVASPSTDTISRRRNPASVGSPTPVKPSPASPAVESAPMRVTAVPLAAEQPASRPAEVVPMKSRQAELPTSSDISRP